MSDSRLISLAPEPLRAALHTARRNLDLEVRLIDDLLDVTRISRGRLQLTHEQIDLHQVIQEVIDMLSVETQRRGITVVTAFDAPQHSVVGDPVRLRQVFWNLLGNATKFTNAGGTVTIASSAGAAGFIQVTVSDTGTGMEPRCDRLDQLAGRRRQRERRFTPRPGWDLVWPSAVEWSLDMGARYARSVQVRGVAAPSSSRSRRRHPESTRIRHQCRPSRSTIDRRLGCGSCSSKTIRTAQTCCPSSSRFTTTR